jgi:hypothetical protein
MLSVLHFDLWTELSVPHSGLCCTVCGKPPSLSAL